jgi:peptidoglycan-associated lipoprotein
VETGEIMKKRFYTSIVLSSLLGSLVLFGAGCSPKTVVPPTSAGSSGSMSGGKDISYPSAEGGYSEENLPTEGTLDDTAAGSIGGESANALDNQTDEYKRVHGRSSDNLYPIYFDFDRAAITPDMTDVIVRNAEYLNSMPGTAVIIEGNCDERGTNEYNLALGERRSINAQQFLIDLGVDPSRIRTLSYGEEKPLFPGLDEDAYSQNRRADFVIE